VSWSWARRLFLPLLCKFIRFHNLHGLCEFGIFCLVVLLTPFRVLPVTVVPRTRFSQPVSTAAAGAKQVSARIATAQRVHHQSRKRQRTSEEGVTLVVQLLIDGVDQGCVVAVVTSVVREPSTVGRAERRLEVIGVRVRGGGAIKRREEFKIVFMVNNCGVIIEKYEKVCINFPSVRDFRLTADS
jgi:hypothetical protein